LPLSIGELQQLDTLSITGFSREDLSKELEHLSDITYFNIRPKITRRIANPKVLISIFIPSVMLFLIVRRTHHHNLEMF